MTEKLRAVWARMRGFYIASTVFQKIIEKMRKRQ